ncbi:MAG: hypothetical protein Kow0032_01180 [Methyloligellaceae bacterium]
MAKPKDEDEQYDEKEAQRRFEQALRGARKVDPKSLQKIRPKAVKKPAKQRA